MQGMTSGKAYSVIHSMQKQRSVYKKGSTFLSLLKTSKHLTKGAVQIKMDCVNLIITSIVVLICLSFLS